MWPKAKMDSRLRGNDDVEPAICITRSPTGWAPTESGATILPVGAHPVRDRRTATFRIARSPTGWAPTESGATMLPVGAHPVRDRVTSTFLHREVAHRVGSYRVGCHDVARRSAPCARPSHRDTCRSAPGRDRPTATFRVVRSPTGWAPTASGAHDVARRSAPCARPPHRDVPRREVAHRVGSYRVWCHRRRVRRKQWR